MRLLLASGAGRSALVRFYSFEEMKKQITEFMNSERCSLPIEVKLGLSR